MQGMDIASLKALRCPECRAFLRPDVVLFTESLPADVWRRASRVALPQSQSLCLSLSLFLSLSSFSVSTPLSLFAVHRSDGPCGPRESARARERERERESERALLELSLTDPRAPWTLNLAVI